MCVVRFSFPKQLEYITKYDSTRAIRWPCASEVRIKLYNMYEEKEKENGW